MGRLTDHVFTACADCYSTNCRIGTNKVENCKVRKMVYKLQEYEDIGTVEELKTLKEKQEKGLLIELPCKVGDIVYYLRNFPVCGSEFYGFVKPSGYKIQKIRFDLDNLNTIGNDVFLTEQEAEAALFAKYNAQNEK